jgi:hypothetical protein
MNKLVLLAALFALASQAAAPQPERMRGTIRSFDGQTLQVATADHGVVKLAVGGNTGINGLEKKTVADIHDDTFIGTTAVKGPDGHWQATEVHIFPESMRGAGEGHYAWDQPNSTMTNAAVTGIAGKRNGRTLHLKYATNQGGAPGGEVDVEITQKTAIVAFTAGDRTLLVPGASVFALVVPQAGDTAAALAIVVETRGVKPPM